MHKKFRIFICFALLLIVGCAGNSREDNQEFRSEVATNVSVDMPLVKAMENLAKAGFSCDDRSHAPEISCTRMKDNILLYSCMQRVNLAPDPERKTVVAVKPSGIVCAGF